MDKEAMAKLLPEEPPEGLKEWAIRNVEDEIGQGYLVMESERIKAEPDLCQLMMGEPGGKSVWAAHCTCTACMEDFYTQKVPGMDAINMAFGEDGAVYPLYAGYEMEGWDHVAPVLEGEVTGCPMCGSDVKLISAKNLRGGRIRRRQVLSACAIEGYAVLVYWLLQRTVYEWGLDEYTVMPRDAFVVTEKGNVVHYTHTTKGGLSWESELSQWRLASQNRDTWNRIYHDWGSINNRCCGGIIYPRIPSMVGTTAEKTGLYRYLVARCQMPVEYLREQRRHPGLENLVNGGHGDLVEELVQGTDSNAYYAAADRAVLDLTKRKPHEILRMTRAEYRQIQNDNTHLSHGRLRMWKRYREQGGALTCPELLGLMEKVGENTVHNLMDLMVQEDRPDIPKTLRYLEKQGLRPNEVRLLLDTRRMERQLSGRQTLDREELWPRRLVAVHDRVAEQLQALQQKEKREKYKKGFDLQVEKYGSLEWSDGDLCVRLPRAAEELVQEGKVLRHCVGGYCGGHAEGKSLIFFVRRARRPERSYYTLNIGMDGVPREIQLHGYGNERHGENKEHIHHIPNKVRAFCDRWKAEVLMPYYEQTKKEKSA